MLLRECTSPPVVKDTTELPQVVVVKAMTHVVCYEPAVALTCFLDLLLIMPLGQKSQQEIVFSLKLSNFLVIVDRVERF